MKRAAFILLMVIAAARLETIVIQSWTRSYSYSDMLVSQSAFESRGQTFLRQRFVHSAYGGISLTSETNGPVPTGPAPLRVGHWAYHNPHVAPLDYPRSAGLNRVFAESAGIQVGTIKDRFHDGVFVAVPYWVLAVLVFVIPICPAFLLAWRPARRWRRRGRGLCAYCGYDLRGTSGGQCPECGAGRAATAGSDALSASR